MEIVESRVWKIQGISVFSLKIRFFCNWVLGRTAEQAFSSDPDMTMIKLHRLADALAVGYCLEFNSETTQADLLFKLQRENLADTRNSYTASHQCSPYSMMRLGSG